MSGNHCGKAARPEATRGNTADGRYRKQSHPKPGAGTERPGREVWAGPQKRPPARGHATSLQLTVSPESCEVSGAVSCPHASAYSEALHLSADRQRSAPPLLASPGGGGAPQQNAQAQCPRDLATQVSSPQRKPLCRDAGGKLLKNQEGEKEAGSGRGNLLLSKTARNRTRPPTEEGPMATRHRHRHRLRRVSTDGDSDFTLAAP